MNVQASLEYKRALEMHNFVASQIAGKYDDHDRHALFASFVSLAQSHHEAILVLAARERLAGSAFALFRPLVEVCYRALFTAFLATPEQLEKIKNGGDPYGRFNDLALALDTFFKTDGLFAIHAGEAWKFLNGMTHGGLEQLSRRINTEGIVGAHFDNSDIRVLCNSSTAVLVKTAIQFLGACGRPEASRFVSDKYISLYNPEA